MRNLALIALVGSCLLSGCTVVGAVTGGSLAHGHNGDREVALARGEYAQPEISVATSTLQGAAVGAVIDTALLFIVASHTREAPLPIPCVGVCSND